MNKTTKPPTAQKKPEKSSIHGHTRVDEYNWLRDFNNPKTKKYLNDENKYVEQMMKDTKKLQRELYTQMRSRILEDDISVKIKRNGYYYY